MGEEAPKATEGALVTNLPILYSFRRCPYAMRARMAIAVSGRRVRLREVLLRDKPAEMIAASPKGTVPVLIVGDNVIDESLAVMDWALAKNDPEGWLAPDDGEDGADLIAACDGDFKHHLDRYKYATRYEDADPETHRAEGAKFLEALAARLGQRQHLCGAKRSRADIAIFPFVRQFRIADEAWFDEHAPASVRTWLKGLMGSELFASVMEKYPQWKETGEEVVFGGA